jgi:hypothetical protein
MLASKITGIEELPNCAVLTSKQVAALLNISSMTLWELTHRGEGPPRIRLCRRLIEVSTYAPETPLTAYRGDTLCLKVRSIGEAAKLEISPSKGVGFRPRP